MFLLAAASALGQGGYAHLEMGNPSGASEDPREANNFLMVKEYFAWFNNAKGTPNWVSWHLTREDLALAPACRFIPTLNCPPASTA